MKIVENLYFRISIVVIISVVAGIMSFNLIGLDKREAKGYDEQMWTSSSITSYHMYFNGYIRNTKELDNWFPTYAWNNKMYIFSGARIDAFQQDTVKFPYDFIVVKTKGIEGNSVIKYDTIAFPREDFQWYDRAIWTFGWKAPNVGKYIMGAWIHLNASKKENPAGYFEFAHPTNHPNVKSKKIEEYDSLKYAPSTLYSSSPFSFAPDEYIYLARVPNAIATMLIISLICIAGWLYIHFWVGCIAAVWLILNSAFLDVNTAVGLDSFATLFTTLSVFLVIGTLNLIRKNKPWWMIITAAVSAAIVIGLAIGSKLNAGVMVFITIVLYVLTVISLLIQTKQKQTTPKKGSNSPSTPSHQMKEFLPKIVVAGAITGIISVGLFIQLNPQFQGETTKKIQATRSSIDEYFDKRAGILTINQVQDKFTSLANVLNTAAKTNSIDASSAQQFNSRMQSLAQRIQGDQQKKNFSSTLSKRWTELMKIEKDMETAIPNGDFSTSSFHNWAELKKNMSMKIQLMLERIAYVSKPDENYYGTFGALIKMPFNLLDGLFAIIGIGFAAAISWKSYKNSKVFSSLAMIGIGFMIILWGNTDFLWIDWTRYFTPVFPLYSLLIGFGIYQSILFITSKLIKK